MFREVSPMISNFLSGLRSLFHRSRLGAWQARSELLRFLIPPAVCFHRYALVHRGLQHGAVKKLDVFVAQEVVENKRSRNNVARHRGA